MKSYKLIVAAALGTMLFSSAAAWAQDCTPSDKFQTVSPGKLSVAIYEYPPFTVIGSDGSIGGVDGDIAKAIAKKYCLQIEAVVVDAAAIVQNVLTKKADIGTGDWYRTAERAKVLGLSYPLYIDQMGIYSKTGLKTVKELEGKKVGSVAGFLWVDDLQKVLGDNLSLYQNPVAIAQDLQSGRIDAAVDSYGTGVYAQAKGGYPGIKINVSEPDPRVAASGQPAQSNLLYSKDNTAFGEALDAAIKEMHENGELAKILTDNGLAASGADTGEPRLIE
jgi:polar amino acid transport system substrate-binding protein